MVRLLVLPKDVVSIRFLCDNVSDSKNRKNLANANKIVLEKNLFPFLFSAFSHSVLVDWLFVSLIS